MTNPSTVLSQLQHLLPLHEFESFVGQHVADRYVKKLTTKNQLSILLYAQATGKDSLRDIEAGLSMWDSTWYHLGLQTAARSTLARANEKRPYIIYESLFYELLKKCQNFSSGTASFSFKNDLYAIDSTTIDVCLSLFPWAHFRREKGAIKLHTLFNVRSQIPELIIISDGKVGDLTAIRDIDLSRFAKGTIFVFDRGYTDYAFLWKIKEAGHHFVIRLKKSAHIMRLPHCCPLEKGIIGDERIAFVLDEAEKDYPEDLRLVTYIDEVHEQTYEFITDMFDCAASVVSAVYKSRWQIELFFKWIKQHLKIKTFLGTSKNAVLSQIWVAMIYYLLLAWLKFQTKFRGTLLDLTRIIQEVLMRNISIINLLNLTPKTLPKILSRASPPQNPLF